MTLCGLAIPKNLTFQLFPGGQEKQTSVTQDSALFQKKKNVLLPVQMMKAAYLVVVLCNGKGERKKAE